jgi:O-methyltransferase
MHYDDWFESVFHKRVPTPGANIATSWIDGDGTPWGRRAHVALDEIELDYAKELLKEIKENNVPGDLVEFGISEGRWVNFLWELTEEIGLDRRIYGFDSFEGLPPRHPDYDTSNWYTGQYACGWEQVRKNVKADERKRIKLVKGFFDKSLRGADAKLAETFCYVRIDSDLYESAVHCLNYLAPRLVDGAVLIFDDWPHRRGIGEQRAFEEWLPQVPHLRFEFLFYNTAGHFYTRVHREP